jgi:hypothetical protein
MAEILNERNDDVYANFAFDGYQIDQLGRRSTLYNYNRIPSICVRDMLLLLKRRSRLIRTRVW